MTSTSTGTPAPKLYINNKELLAAIHESKKSFCYYIEPEHANYDAIVLKVEDITDELIGAVRKKKANPRGKPSVPIENFPVESLVFRVMTYEHIPLDPDRPRKSRVTDKPYARTAFPPFKHYMLKDGKPVEVLRSHWKDGFDNGVFEPDSGRINNRLAMMFMLLVERYSRRGNWRGYTYVDEMRGQALLQLSQIGLQFDESKSDNPFAFYTTAIRNCFVRILNNEKKTQNIRDDMLIIAGAAPSYTRQIENELENKFPLGKQAPPKKAPVKRLESKTTIVED